MTEREAFEALMRSEGRRTEQDADGVYSHVQGEWYVWQAACQWQREQDAKVCEDLAGGSGLPSAALTCASEIRAQGER